MEKTINLIAKIGAWVLAAIGLILLAIVWANAGDPALLNDTVVTPEIDALRNRFLNPVFGLTGIILIIGIILILFFVIRQMIDKPHLALYAVGVLVVFAIIVGISYALASGSIEGDVYTKFTVSEAKSRYVGTALYSTYITFVLTVVTLIGTEITKLFK